MAVHFQLLISTVLYLLAFLSSLLAITTVVVAKSTLDGKCFLFDTFTKEDDVISVVEYNALPCNANLYVSVAASVYSFIMAVYHGYATVAASRENHIGRTLWVMPWLLLNSLVCVIILIIASMFSIGFQLTCSRVKDFPNPSESCFEQLNKVKWSSGEEKVKNTTYNCMSVAEISNWVSFLLWAMLLGLEGLRLIRNRRARSAEAYSDPTTSDTSRIAELTPTA